MKLDKKITFRVTKEYLDFLDSQTCSLECSLHLESYRGGFIRVSLREYHCFLKNKDKPESERENFDFYPEQYDIKNIVRSNTNKRKKGGDCNYVTLSVRVSDEDRKFVNEQVKIISEKIGKNISIGDFIRFCVAGLKYYFERKQQEKINSASKNTNFLGTGV